MGALRVVLTVIFIIVCIAMVILVLMQEGKGDGISSLSGSADSYWGKNKGRSMEGRLVKITRFLVILFLLLAVVLNVKAI